MTKSCSNCLYDKNRYCKKLKTSTRLFSKPCVFWSKQSTIQSMKQYSKAQSKIKRESIKQEKQIAKKTGGRRQPMSGAGYHKGDVKTKLHLIEIKYTNKNSYALNKSTMKKLFYEATYEDRIPYLQVRIGRDNYCILRKEDFDAL